MLALRSIFKSLLPVLLVLAACKNLPRDNVLDPKNPDSHATSLVLVEAFVNLANPAPYNRWALQSLDALKQKYPNLMIVCEYHRDITADSVTYDDPYNQNDAQTLFRLLQDRYVSQNSQAPRAVPDVYLNGAVHRFVGAYDPQSLQLQMEPVLLQALSRQNQYRLEPLISSVNDSTLEVKCQVAGLGNREVNNKRLRIIFLKKREDQGLILHTVLKLVWPGIVLKKIAKGSYKTVDAGQYHFKELPDGIVFALTSDDELTVLQAKYYSITN